MTTMIIRLFFVLIALMGAQLSLIEAHSNTVAVAGSEVIMKCQPSSGNCSGVDWKKRTTQTGQTEVRISKNNQIFPGYRDRFSVDGSSGCNLVIKNVSLTDAGRFTCDYVQNSNTKTEASLLFVLESLPKCSVRVNASSEGIAAEGDEVQFTCDVKFNATEGEGASMTWKSLDNFSVSVKPNTPGRLLHSVVAQRPGIPSFECITTFNIPKDIEDLASNIPTAPSCMTENNRTLLYPVTTVTLTPTLSIYPLGSEITCFADGYPLPSYQWQSKEDADGANETWTDIIGETRKAFTPSKTKLHNGTIYRCAANNSIRGKSFHVSSRTFRVNGKSDDTGFVSNATEASQEQTVYIIAAAAGSGLVALIIVIVIVRICQLRGNEAKNRTGNDKSSGGDQIPLKSTPCLNGSINPQMTTVPIASIQPHPRPEAVKRPQVPPPEPRRHRGDSKQKREDPPPQKEEVLYADLAMEQGPKRRVQQAPTNDPHAVYADVQLA